MHIIFKAASGGLTPYLIQYHPLHCFMPNSLFSGSEFGHFNLLPLLCNTCIFSGPPSCTGLKNHLAPRQLVYIMIFFHMMSLPGSVLARHASLRRIGLGYGRKMTHSKERRLQELHAKS